VEHLRGEAVSDDGDTDGLARGRHGEAKGEEGRPGAG
jgi:hypothetical protein